MEYKDSNIVKKTLLDIKNMYGSKIIRYRHQRPIVNEHILDIKEYIEEFYDKKEFYLPPIVLVANNNDQYEIIDGLHRCVSIAEKINEKHPCMNTYIYIIYKDIMAESTDAIKLFMNINKARPMPRLYFEPDYINKIYSDTVRSLDIIYDDIIINSNRNIISSKINKYKLDEIINAENIEKLIINGDITGLDNNEIFKLIRKCNDYAIDDINRYMNLSVFDNFDSLNNTNKIKLVDFINTIIHMYNKTININAERNNLKASTILPIISSIIERWNYVKSKRINIKKNIRYKPMVLGLFPKIPILELESVFIKSGLIPGEQNYELDNIYDAEPGS